MKIILTIASLLLVLNVSANEICSTKLKNNSLLQIYCINNVAYIGQRAYSVMYKTDSKVQTCTCRMQEGIFKYIELILD